MTPAPRTVDPDCSVADAQRLMRETGCHHVPVVDNGILVGMVSSGDIVRALIPARASSQPVSAQAQLEAKTVASVMTRSIISVPHTATLLDACRLLNKGDYHALPVVAPGGALLGILTSTDLIEAALDTLVHPVAEAGIVSRDAARANGGTDHALRELFLAVQHYLNSGRADREHSRLLAAFERARETLSGPTVVL